MLVFFLKLEVRNCPSCIVMLAGEFGGVITDEPFQALFPAKFKTHPSPAFNIQEAVDGVKPSE